MANPATLKVKLLHGTIVEGASEPRGEAIYGKVGEIHDVVHAMNADAVVSF